MRMFGKSSCRHSSCERGLLLSIFDFKRKKYRTFLQDSETGEEIAEEYEKGRGVWKKHDVQDGKGSEMRENLIRKHYWFSGRVQGVGFRYRACYIASSLGVTGWVRNNWDGKLTTVYRRNFSRYRLIDINNDGIKELMLHNYPWAVFFTYYKGKVTPLIYGSTRGAYLKGQYLTIKTGTSSENICRTYILQNGKVKQIINYFHTTSSAYPVPIYEVNGKRYSKTAFFKVYNKYMNNAKLLF